MSTDSGNKHENAFIEIGVKLKSFRLDAGYTQAEAANLMRVTITTISNWETGRKLPTLDNLNRVAQAYRIPESYINFLINLAEMSRKELINTICNMLDER